MGALPLSKECLISVGFFGRGYLKDFPNRNWWKAPVDRVLEPGQGAATPSPSFGDFRSWRCANLGDGDMASAPSLLRQIADIVARLCLLVFMCYVHVWEVPSATVEDWEKMNPEVRCNIYIYIFFRHCPLQEHRGTFQVDQKNSMLLAQLSGVGSTFVHGWVPLPSQLQRLRVPHMVQQ